MLPNLYIFRSLFNGLQVIDLARVSQELAYLASDADLVVLEGMVSVLPWVSLEIFIAFMLGVDTCSELGCMIRNEI